MSSKILLNFKMQTESYLDLYLYLPQKQIFMKWKMNSKFRYGKGTNYEWLG